MWSNVRGLLLLRPAPGRKALRLLLLRLVPLLLRLLLLLLRWRLLLPRLLHELLLLLLLLLHELLRLLLRLLQEMLLRLLHEMLLLLLLLLHPPCRARGAPQRAQALRALFRLHRCLRRDPLQLCLQLLLELSFQFRLLCSASRRGLGRRRQAPQPVHRRAALGIQRVRRCRRWRRARRWCGRRPLACGSESSPALSRSPRAAARRDFSGRAELGSAEWHASRRGGEGAR